MITALAIILLLLGYLIGTRGKHKRRPLPPCGSALQQQPEPVWGRWDANWAKVMKR